MTKKWVKIVLVDLSGWIRRGSKLPSVCWVLSLHVISLPTWDHHDVRKSGVKLWSTTPRKVPAKASVICHRCEYIQLPLVPAPVITSPSHFQVFLAEVLDIMEQGQAIPLSLAYFLTTESINITNSVLVPECWCNFNIAILTERSLKEIHSERKRYMLCDMIIFKGSCIYKISFITQTLIFPTFSHRYHPS